MDIITDLEVLSAVSVKQMTLKLVLSQTLLADRAEVVSLVGLSDKEVGVGLQVSGSPVRGRGWADYCGPGSLHCDPSHLQSLNISYQVIHAASEL